MMGDCPALAPDSGFVRSMLDFVDCQAQTLGASGYHALAAPGSTLSLMLTGFLVLFVAFFGYRLLLGHAPDVREGVLALVKVGIVLALATSWPAYRTLIYDVVMRGPAELVAEIGAPSALPGAGGGLVARLDVADQALGALSVLGAGAPPIIDPNTNQQVSPFAYPPPPFAGFNTFALGGSRLLFLLGAVGSLAAVRLIAGLMLALGPFFIAFLLFDNSRALFEGWVRVLAGAMLGAIGSAVALGIELAALEPWLADLLVRRSANEPMPNMPAELFVVTALFALVLVAIMAASARLAFGFRLARAWAPAAAGVARMLRIEERGAGTVAAATVPPPAESRSRAAAVVDAVTSTTRRESTHAVAALAAAGSDRRAVAASAARAVSVAAAPVPLGQSFRRTSGRVSASAGRRDRQS